MTKRYFKKAVSFLCVLSLLLSVVAPLSLISFAEETKTEFTDASLDIDFNDYAISGNFKTPYTSAGKDGGVFTDGYFFKVEDGTLRYVRSKDEATVYNDRGGVRNSLRAFQAFPLSTTGNAKNSESIIVEDTVVYALTVKYKVNSITLGQNDEIDLYAAYGVDGANGDTIGTDIFSKAKHQVNVYRDPALTEKVTFTAANSDYVTETWYFSYEAVDYFKYSTEPNVGKVKPSHPWLCFDVPVHDAEDDTCRPTSEFDISFDNMKIQTVATANFSVVENGVATSVGSKAAGAVDSAVDFSEAEAQIKANADREVTRIQWFRDKDFNNEVVELSNELYTNKISTEYYAMVTYSGAVENGSTEDFESYKLRESYTGFKDDAGFKVNGYNTTRYNIIDYSDAVSGNKVMSYKALNAVSSQADHTLYVGHDKDLEDHALYKMTFWYKLDPSVETTADWVDIAFYNGGDLYGQMGYPASYGYADICKNAVSLKLGDYATTWTQITLYNYVDIASKSNQSAVDAPEKYPYLLAPELYITSKSGKDVALLIDDVKIEKVVGGGNKTGLVVLNSHGEKNYMAGVPGAELTLANLPNTDTQLFKGWYKDAAFTAAFDATAYADGVLHAYAKFEDKPTDPVDPPVNPNPSDSAICDFENYPSKWQTNNQQMRFDRFTINSDASFTAGGKGLQYHFVPSSDPAVDGTDAEPNTQYNKRFSSSVVMADADGNHIPLKNDTWYEITFKYNAVNVPESVIVAPITSNYDEGAWGGSGANGKYYEDNTFTIPAGQNVGWKENGKIVFKTNFVTEEGCDFIFGAYTSNRAETKVYFDDIKIEETTDPSLNPPVNPGTNPGVSMVDFENYKLRESYVGYRDDTGFKLSGYTNVRYNIVDYADAVSGNKVMNYKTMSQASAQNDHTLYVGNDIDLYDKAMYKMTFWYKLDPTVESTADFIDFYFYNGGDAYGQMYYTEESGFDGIATNHITVNKTEFPTEWKQVTLYRYIDVSSKRNQSAVDLSKPEQYAYLLAPELYITAKSGKDISILIDDVKVEKVCGGGENTSLVAMYDNGQYSWKAGKPGDTLTLPTLPNTDSQKFVGWYADSACTVPFTADKFTEKLIIAYAKYEDNCVNFEGYPSTVTNNNASFRKDRFFITTDYVYGGNKALKYNFDPLNHEERQTHNREISSSFVLYQNGNYVTVEDDTLYKVTFMYKPTSLNSNVTINLLTSHGGNVWEGGDRKYPYYNQYIDTPFTINQNESGSDWKKGVVFFKSNLPDVSGDPYNNSGKTPLTPNELFFWVGSDMDVNNTVYFDNITVSKVEDSMGAIQFITNDQIGTTYQDGYVGDLIKYPDLTGYTGYQFFGWYKDSTFTQKVDFDTVPAGLTKLYAFLIKPSYGSFENYPMNWTTQTGKFRHDRFSISSEVAAADGTKVLKYFYQPWMGTYTSNTECWYAQENRWIPTTDWKATPTNKQRSNVVLLADDNGARFKLDSGGYYKLTFSYNFVSGSEINFIPNAGHVDDMWSGVNTEFTNAQYRITNADKGKGWQTKTLYLKADLKDEKCCYLYLFASLVQDIETLCYFDGFKLERLNTDGMAIFFDYGVDGILADYTEGNVGDKITYPTIPAVPNLDFVGWYTDKECTLPFTATTFNKKGFFTLYAKWNSAKVSTFDFEGVYSTKGINRSDYEIVDGNTVWAVDKINPLDPTHLEREFAATMVMPSGKHYRLEKGTQYVVAVKYYTAILKEGGSMTMLCQTSAKDAVWSERKAASVTKDCIVKQGEWNTVYFYVDAEYDDPEPGEDIANYLGIFVDSAIDCRILVDEVTITRIDPGEAVIFYTLNKEGTTLGIPYKIVSKGTVVTLPKPTLKDFALKGWYKTDEYKEEEKYEGTTFRVTENTNMYGFMYQVRFFNGFEDNRDSYLPDQIINCDPDYDVETGGQRSGKYAMHRKGEWYDYQGFLTIPGARAVSDKKPVLTDNITYTISFWIRIESADHQLGAIRLGGTDAARWSWGTKGNIYNTVALKDISDGEWHQVKFTFTSATYRYALFIPGWVNAWVDDIEIIATPGAEVSKSVEVEEYVAYLKNDKKVVTEEVITIPEDLFVKAGAKAGGSNLMLIILVAAGALLVVGGGVGAFLVVKSKKAKGGNK